MPQSQVLSDVIMSSTTNSTPGADHDSDDEDEVEDGGHFEQSQAIPFSTSCPLTSDRVVSLPSMMTSQGCSSGVIAAASSSEQPGLNGSGPVDSLEQTPLDISLEAESLQDLSDGSCHGNNSAELSVVAEVAGTGKYAADILSEVATPGDTSGLPSQLEMKALKSELKHHPKSGKSSKKRKKKRSHYVPRTKSNKAVPPCKRSKVASVAGNIHHTSTGAKLLTENAPCQLFEVVPVGCIDLKLEDRAINDTDQQWILNKDHQSKNKTLNNDHHSNKGYDPINPIFISDSCEELQNENSAELKESSPDILPPTPGREQVESILQRKKLTVL